MSEVVTLPGHQHRRKLIDLSAACDALEQLINNATPNTKPFLQDGFGIASEELLRACQDVVTHSRRMATPRAAKTDPPEIAPTAEAAKAPAETYTFAYVNLNIIAAVLENLHAVGQQFTLVPDYNGPKPMFSISVPRENRTFLDDTVRQEAAALKERQAAQTPAAIQPHSVTIRYEHLLSVLGHLHAQGGRAIEDLRIRQEPDNRFLLSVPADRKAAILKAVEAAEKQVPVPKKEAGHKFRTYAKLFDVYEAIYVPGALLQLFYKSQWFEFTPLPDSEYEINVKEENKKLLEKLSAR